jgi:hypothetical protein
VRYGRALLQHEPAATTDLLIDLCSGNLGRKRPTDLSSDLKANGSGPGVISYLGVNRLFGTEGNGNGTLALQGTNGTGGAMSPVNGTPDGTSPVGTPMEEVPSYTPPSPRQFFAHFVDHHDLFVHFLEDVALALWNQKVNVSPVPRSGPVPRRDVEVEDVPDPALADQRAVWNTLLELYLASTNSSDATAASTASNKALSLLAHGDTIPYDPMHALVLCSMDGFTDGLVGLWESMGMYEDVLRYWMEKGDSERSSGEVLRYLDMYGPTNRSLYPLVLRYLTSSSAILTRHEAALPGLLRTIDEERIMPPLAVVQLLSRNGVASVGTVKAWLRAKVDETAQEIAADKTLVESYRSETAAKEKQIAELAHVRQPEVFQVTQCAACGGVLDLPAVHFMCKHSYHQRCLSDADPECILCAGQHAMVREMRRNQTRLADRHDLFLSEVHAAEDGFAVVAGAFGRGLFQKEDE